MCRAPTNPLATVTDPLPRLDIELVTRGLAPSRSAAQRLIADGVVFTTPHTVLSKPAGMVHADTPLWLAESDETRFVSRAGAKLAHALTASAIDPAGLTVLDAGMSTGGFTDCLLQAGAAHVVGIEVGHGQLHPKLQADPRVLCLERTHLRAVNLTDLRARSAQIPACGFALAVADLSFISLTKVLAALHGVLAAGAQLLLLVKPQFELSAQDLNHRGIVTDPERQAQAVAQVAAAGAALGWQCLGHHPSALRGTDGNQEFFLHLRTPPSPHSTARSLPL
jgi:23S rRNA (cytidine1920-2'-O)/16S rRNA (cytidine1409-2'-O)-methyltransferase